MQFHVPQFIEVESKIFGPLTFKQFIYLAGGAGFIFILYSLIPLFFTILFGTPILGLALSLAFLKIHGKPFIEVSYNAIRYLKGTKLYLWKKPPEQSIKMKIGKTMEKNKETYLPKLTENKLQELSWSLDIKEKIK